MDNILGKKFGKLTTIEYLGKISRAEYYKFKCECGNEITTSYSKVRWREVSSCGCVKKRCKTIYREHEQRIKRIFSSMKNRCYLKSAHAYEDYGGRGISICDTWKNDFDCFYNWAINNGYEDGLTIDRINVNGNYEISNCRWSNFKTQANNTRSNHILSHDGKDMTISQWADYTGIDSNVLYLRINRGWSVKRALETPIIHKIQKETKIKSKSEYLYKKIHGMSKTPEHKAWRRMFELCYNEKSKLYKNYGGRKIGICESWKESFLNFYKDIGRRPEGCILGRIDINKDFSKDNCRWVSRSTQSKNRRY